MPVSYDRQKRRYRFFFRRQIGGRLHRYTKLLPAGITQAQADQYDREQTARLFAQAGAGEPTISQCVKLYVEHRLPTRKCGARTALELSHLGDLIDGQPLSELGTVSLQYADDHGPDSDAPLAPATIKNRLSYLRAAVRYAHKKHKIGDHDYTSTMSFPTVKNERHVYVDFRSQLPKLLKHCETEELKALVMMAAYSGMRWISEIHRLTKEDIRGGLFRLGDTKNGKPHVVPIHPKLKPYLRFIPFQTGSYALWQQFRAAADAAGFEHVHLHDLRHSFASTLLENGATLGEVGEMLNHSSPIATKRYAHLVVKAKRKVMNRLK